MKKQIKVKPPCEDRFLEEIVANVRKDFENRRLKRRHFEAQWQLNANFLMGNQYCYINHAGVVSDSERKYFWQEREVFNHIAAIAETRLAKLGRVRPKMSVRPASADDNDRRTAKLATKILNSTCERIGFDALIDSATMWSEIAGSSFYKVSWDGNGGKALGLGVDKVKEGDVRIDVCPPYEIFPDSLTAESISDVNSIIHAKALHISDIYAMWGKAVDSEDIDLISFNIASVIGGGGMGCAVNGFSRASADGYCVVIERYTRPSKQKPRGELVTVAGNTLLYYGDLPYLVGMDGEPDLPFVKQDCVSAPASFFGASIIERTIPIQRAYNAVKNRKHEFLNRVATGILAAEDGSVDTDDLQEEGLCPGKILLYRQGSRPPQMLNYGAVPPEFSYEEDRLLGEFIKISGVSEIMRNSHTPGSVSSGVAIQLLIEQDDTRLSLSANNIKKSVRLLAQFILRLFKQCAGKARLSRAAGEDGSIELISWSASDITCDDVVFDTVNELSATPAAQQSMLFDLLRSGLLHNSEGKLTDSMRRKILDVLGYGGWEHTLDTEAMHSKRAQNENMLGFVGEPDAQEIDNHGIHIDEHTAFLLTPRFDNGANAAERERLVEHIRRHKLFLSLNTEKGE